MSYLAISPSDKLVQTHPRETWDSTSQRALFHRLAITFFSIYSTFLLVVVSNVWKNEKKRIHCVEKISYYNKNHRSRFSRNRDQQHRAQQQLNEHRGFGRRSWWYDATTTATERPQGWRTILPGRQHSSSSRSSSTSYGDADPRSPFSVVPCTSASATASDSQWTPVCLLAAKDLDWTEEKEQYVYNPVYMYIRISIYV